MPTAKVTFRYHTGATGDVFANSQFFLEGSWNAAGQFSSAWTSKPMQRVLDETGSTTFVETVDLDVAGQGATFFWGVSVVLPSGQREWAIPTEVRDASQDRRRQFIFSGADQSVSYYLTHCRLLGANRCKRNDGTEGVRFSVWAPNATAVEVVFGKLWDANDPNQAPLGGPIALSQIAGGYIADDGTGIHPHRGALVMQPASTNDQTLNGIWMSNPDDPALPPGAEALEHWPYMYRITQQDGTSVYRTDLYSRCQIGYGDYKPAGAPYTGLLSGLDGVGSCSVTVNPDTVTEYFEERPPYLNTNPPSFRVFPERHFIRQEDFWADEYRQKPIPRRVEDLVIYELHTGALGFGRQGPGTLEDAINLLDHIAEMNFNAVELLPLSEFGGGASTWGYSTSHHFAIEYSGGGRDQYKFFVRECHRRGLAVIMDVVYNHFAHDATRAEWHYDSPLEQDNIYYWYEGMPNDYPAYQAAARDLSIPANRRPPLDHGGYLDNMSTSYAPRYHEENVRKLFISSAVALMREFHVDGFRLDQTTSIHAYNVLHADGRSVSSANIFGAKLLREFGRTVKFFNPEIMLMAEDHSDWDQVILPTDKGGMGIDARWYSEYYHHLAGDTNRGDDTARLLYIAATKGASEPLRMSYFAGALQASQYQKVVYNESHDEAGNSQGPFWDDRWDPQDKDKEFTSHRGIRVSSNMWPLVGATRQYAEARCRFAWGVTVLSAGTPLTLFGEEVGAEQRFKYNAVLANREDIVGLKNGTGANLARFYREINAFRLAHSALRGRNLEILHVHDQNRVLCFKRWLDGEEYIVFSTLSDRPYDAGYTVRHPGITAGSWQEIFNSDSSAFGGHNVGNAGAAIKSAGGTLAAVIPFAGFVVLRLENGQ